LIAVVSQFSSFSAVRIFLKIFFSGFSSVNFAGIKQYIQFLSGEGGTRRHRGWYHNGDAHGARVEAPQAPRGWCGVVEEAML